MSKTLQRNLEAKLAALNGPEWDSSDDEEVTDTKSKRSNKNSKNVLTGNKDLAVVNNTSSDTKSKKKQNKHAIKFTSIIRVGHLPKLFEEKELIGFFGQFGKIVGVHLCRSPRTGVSKRYGFIQFGDAEVASIAAEAMNNYILDFRQLTCVVLPEDKIHDDLTARLEKGLVYALKRKRLFVDPKKKAYKASKDALVDASAVKKRSENLVKKETKTKNLLKEMGIDYDFPGFSSSTPKEKAKRKVSEDEGQVSAKKKKVSSYDKNSQSAVKSKRKVSDDEEQQTNKTPKKRTTTDTGTITIKSSSKKKISITTNDDAKNKGKVKTPKKKASTDSGKSAAKSTTKKTKVTTSTKKKQKVTK